MMHELCSKVERELENIGEKGITNSNLDTAYKLIDIYKDIKEAEYYKQMTQDGKDSYDTRSYRGDWDDKYAGRGSDERSERTERYLERIRDGVHSYNAGRRRYMDGDSKQRMIEGIEMTMTAIVNFVEFMNDFAESSQEKEIVKKYIEKLKKI